MADALAEVPGKRSYVDLLNFLADTIAVTQMAEGGARVLVHISDQLLELSGGVERTDGFQHAAEAARDAIRDDFALLRNNALMGAWGALEACIDDVAVSWLAATSGACANTAISALRVSLGDYLVLSDDAKWPWLLDQIKRAQSSTLKAGVGQFESVLGAVGLGGEVDPHLRRAILYTKAMRNVIAHRGGHVDARFVAECPGFAATVGERLSITSSQFMAAISAIITYLEVVYLRAKVAAGRPPEPLFVPPWVSDLESLSKAFERGPAEG